MIGIIPVRMGSIRFPGKPLAMIGGRPMIERMVDIVATAKRIYPYYVATADREIIEYCEREKLPYIVTAADCLTGTQRVFDSMRQLSNQPGDCVMNIQGDEPTLKPESLDRLATVFDDPRATIASLCFRPSDRKYLADPARVKVLVTDNGTAMFFGRTVNTRLPLFDHFRQHIGVYGFRLDILPQIGTMPPDTDLEQRPWMRHWDIRMVDVDYETVAVDRPDDIARVESVLAERAG
jgi:3-deoxy-manno-octulosonate cytidylyltransferase (CMP-KDO synthetase)